MLVDIWWLLAPVLPCLIVGAVYATSRWKAFTADMIRFQLDESRKRPDSYTEQMATQRLKALAMTLDDSPEFLRRALDSSN